MALDAAPKPDIAAEAKAATRAEAEELAPDPSIVIRPGGKRAVRAEAGGVTSVEAHATRAGVEVLERGGNAVDAAVAVAYMLAVTHPSAGNIGGGGFMLVRPKGATTVAIDFRETAPASLTQERFDAMIAAGASTPAAVGVPGTVAGLSLAHARFGKLPLATLLAPAIEVARKGHKIKARQAQTIRWNWPKLRRDPVARAVFGDGTGAPKRQGTLLKRPLLAQTLERIRDQGAAGFYEGATARSIVDALGGALSLEDLKNYRPKLRQPLRFKYRGLDVEVMPPPSAGGVTLMITLLTLDHLRAHERKDPAQNQHLFIEASRRSQAERRFSVADPDRWAPNERNRELARWTNPELFLRRAPIDERQSTPSSRAHPLFSVGLKELEHTTHFSIIDREGNVVSCTTTLSAGFGAKIVVPGADIVLNNSVAAFGTAGKNRPLAGFRSTSSMAPALVLNQGRPVLVLGSPGGDTIPSTIAQVLRNVVDASMTIDEAVEAPRIHHGFVPDKVFYERERPPPPKLLRELRLMGHELAARAAIGDANNVLIDDEGTAWLEVDPREGGLALAVKPAEPP